MTTVTLIQTGNTITAFTVTGHTAYAEAGSDIVCAGISSVVWTAINGLENVIGIPVSYETRDGFVSCKIPPLSPNQREKADVLLASMAAYFKDLAAQYKEYVKVLEV